MPLNKDMIVSILRAHMSWELARDLASAIVSRSEVATPEAVLDFVERRPSEAVREHKLAALMRDAASIVERWDRYGNVNLGEAVRTARGLAALHRTPVNSFHASTPYKRLVQRFANGRKQCNCGDAYLGDDGMCPAGCAANKYSTRDEIASKAEKLLSAPATVEQIAEILRNVAIGQQPLTPDYPEMAAREIAPLARVPEADALAEALDSVESLTAECADRFDSGAEYGSAHEACAEARSVARTTLAAYRAARTAPTTTAHADRREGMTDPHSEAFVDNLCMLCARMARRLRQHKEHVEDAKLADQAEEFLRANGRLGSILRTAQSTAPPPIPSALIERTKAAANSKPTEDSATAHWVSWVEDAAALLHDLLAAIDGR